MFDIKLTYAHRKNGKTRLQEYSFQKLLERLRNGMDRPATNDYLGPYLLDKIENTKVMELAIQSAEEIDREYPAVPNGISETAIADGDESGMYMKYGPTDEVVAILVWYPYAGNAWLATSWTHPDHRKRGLYRTLYEQLQKECVARGLKSISCGVKGGNTISQQAHEALGMEKDAVTYTGQVLSQGGSPRTPAQFLSR